MKRSSIVIALTLIFGFLIKPTFASTQDQWTFLTQKDGIKVYNKSVKDSKVKALKVEVVLSTNLSAVVALLLDVPGAEKWVSHTKSATLVKRVSPAELYYYSEVNLPWPLENRDFVAHVKVTQDKTSKVVIVEAPAIPGVIAEKKGIVRVSHSLGYWIITPIDKARVKIEYSLQVDPGGIIPAWAVNALSSQGPIDSFMNMKEMLLRPEYKNAVLPFIEN